MNAQQHRDNAVQSEQKAQESFNRCDTDGFLSQWAHGLNAELERTRAMIADEGGILPFPCLMQDDRRVDAKLIPGKFGEVWILSDEEEDRFGRKFVPFEGQGNRSRVQKALGLHEGSEDAPAAARLYGKGSGLSGRAWVIVFRTDGK